MLMEDSNETKGLKNKKWIKITSIVLVVAVAVAGIGYGSYYLLSKRNLEPASDFTVTTLSGGNFTLSDYSGRVVLLDFMSLTCQPCKELMPELVSISEEFNDSLIILSVDVDSSDNATNLQAFKESYNATWQFAFDTDDLIGKYSVLTIPKTIVIDTEGYITFAEVGLSAENNLQETIQKTIEGTAGRINTGKDVSLYVLAIGAGILSFFSPCAFPLLPGYMAYNLDLLVRTESKEVQKDEEEKDKKSVIRKRLWKSFLWGSAAAFGVALFYMIIGLITAFVGEIVSDWVEYITPAVGALLIIFGIISLTPLTLDMSKAVNAISNLGSKRRRRKKKLEGEDESSIVVSEEDEAQKQPSEMRRLLQLFLYGITYALASLGCNLPILLSLVVGAIGAGAFFQAIIIFLIYSVSMALLMIFITILVGLSKDALIDKLQSSTKFVKILSGALLILAGGFLIGWFLWNRYKV